MSRDLPSLTSLRAFEAAARHLSFTKAAAELHVTQAAISHQVKGLEQHLGVRLFRRLTRRLLLTDEAQTLLNVVQRSFDNIAGTVQQLSKQSSHGTLDVVLRPFFAARWLSQRLSRFWVQHPEITLRLHHSSATIDFPQADLDLAVRWGDGNWQGVEVELLVPAKIAPVCSPSVLEGDLPLRTPADLRHHSLMHDEHADLWPRWFAGVGLPDIDTPVGPVIDDTNVRIQAAIDGQGFTLAPLALLRDDIATGRLVTPFDYVLDHLGYYIVYPRGSLAQPKIRAFRDWLLAEASQAHLPG